MAKVLYVFKVWVKKTHQFNDVHGLRLPVVIILNGYDMVHHLLDVPTVFLHDQGYAL